MRTAMITRTIMTMGITMHITTMVTARPQSDATRLQRRPNSPWPAWTQPSSTIC